MDHVNYSYHKFAGYVLFPFRLTGLFIISVNTILITLLSDILKNDFLFNKIVHLFTKIYLSIFGFKVYIDGEYSSKSSLIVSNHINMFDHFVLTYVCDKLNSFVVSNRFNVSPINILSNKVDCIYVTKQGGVTNKIKKHITEGNKLIIYPDGCNLIPDKKLIAPFRSGAFVPKAPIQPIVIRYVPSSNMNMNWYYEDSSKDNTLFSLLKSYLLDGDMQVYVKVLPLQYYKESYKSHEDYRDEIYSLMTKELSLLPEQKPNLLVGEPSSEYIMKYLIYLLYLSGFCYVIGNYQFACYLFMNFIAGYFCHFYPTKNTCLVDSLTISYTFTRSTFTSIQNQYDLYIRFLYMIFTLTRGYRWLQYKDIKPFDERKHVWNTWIPMYTFTLYPLLLNTLELYHIL